MGEGKIGMHLQLDNIYRYMVVNAGILLAVTLVIYGPDLQVIFRNALVLSTGNISNYVLAIPGLIAFVIYRKRHVLKVLATLKDEPRWLNAAIGVPLCGLALVLSLYGASSINALDYQIYSMPLFLAGGIILLFNFKMVKSLFFALFLLIFFQPPSGEIVGEIAAELSWVSAVILYNLLHFLTINIDLQTTYGAPSFELVRPDGLTNSFVVGEPSSGVFSTIGMTVFALFTAYIANGKMWKRMSILALSLPLFFVLNTIRIGTVMLLWYTFDETVAEAFHLIGGMLMVAIGTILLLIIGEKLLGISFQTKNTKRNRCINCDLSEDKNENFCLICGRLLRHLNVKLQDAGLGSIALVVFAIIFSASSYTQPNLASAYKGLGDLDIASITGPETTTYMMPTVNGVEPQFAYRDKAIESVLRQDLAVAFRYTKEDASPNISPLTIYTGVQISTGKHTWEDSMVIYPSKVGRPTATVIEVKDIAISKEKSGKFFMYQRPNSNLTEVVLYWFERMPLRFGSDIEGRNVQIIVWTYAKNLVRSGIVDREDNINGIQGYMVHFAEQIKNYWDQSRPVITDYTSVSTIINQYSIPLIGVITAIPALAVLLQLLNNIRTRKRYKQLLTRLNIQDEILIIKAIEKSRGSSTGMSVMNNFKLLRGEQFLDMHKFINLLTNAKNAGFIKTDIIIRNDEPLMMWKSKIDSKNSVL
jgi:exosortase/archaeosortase family protein